MKMKWWQYLAMLLGALAIGFVSGGFFVKLLGLRGKKQADADTMEESEEVI